MYPVVRFVDPALRGSIVVEHDGNATEPAVTPGRPDSTSGWPTVTIRDETRFVLAAPASNAILNTSRLDVPSDGVVALTLPLGPAFASSKHVILRGRWQRDGVWHDLSLPISAVTPGAQGPQVEIRFQVPRHDQPGTIGAYIEAHSTSWGSRTTVTTQPIDIPAGARLELATGVTEATQALGTVRFTVNACTESDCDTIITDSQGPTGQHSMPWRDQIIDLRRFRGKRARFVLSTLAESAGEGYPVGVWANPTVYAPTPREEHEANVILLSIDTLAAGHLPTYGYPYDTAPFIKEKFGREGTVFDTVVAAATSTPPSHMTMFTGEYPSVHGVTTGFQAVPDWLITLPETLRSAGIETAAVTEDGWLGAHHGFGRGFNVYAENKSQDLAAPSGQIDVTFSRAKEWLSRNHEKRFFLFLHTFQVHAPYVPPEQYRTLFLKPGSSSMELEAHERNRIAYDQEIRYADDNLRDLFDTLGKLDLDRRTIFILTSDHGEAFGEHGWLGHAAHFHEAVTHVPLLFVGPSILQNQRIKALAGHVDVAPTVLDLFSLMSEKDTVGRSLAPALRSGALAPTSALANPYYTESWSPIAMDIKQNPVRFGAPAFNVRVGTRKLARYQNDGGGHIYEYFDLAMDPNEVAPSSDFSDADVQKLRLLVDAYPSQCVERRKVLATRVPSHDAPTGTPPAIMLTPEQEQKLRALGYLQ